MLFRRDGGQLEFALRDIHLALEDEREEKEETKVKLTLEKG